MQTSKLTFWVLIILLVAGIVSFANTVCVATDPTNMWALLSANFIFFLGITQSGIIFSAVIRLSRSPWGVYFSRLGEILTLAFIPVGVIMFLALYFGGFEHLFYWANPEAAHAAGAHVSPWLDKKLFLIRIIVSNIAFYVISYIYFRTGRSLELNSDAPGGGEYTHCHATLAGFVIFFYVLAQTFVSWDFGMTQIKHWESSIFAPAFWVGNLMAGFSFLFLMALAFIPRDAGEKMKRVLLESMGKVLFGFVLLWIYMYWSQHIVFWYGNLPSRMGPAFKMMKSPYFSLFVIMMFLVFGVPFLALIFRKIKSSPAGMGTVSMVLFVGIWINRYLLVVPNYANGTPTLSTGTGVFLTLGAGAATLLSIYLFRWLFPCISVTTGMKKSSH